MLSKAGKKFNEYHASNPQVSTLFRRFAVEAKESGFRNFGAKAVMARVRWETAIKTKGTFKINNNYTSRYVRLLEIIDPSFVGLFRKKELRADNEK